MTGGLFIGLMSGTSADGIDAALVRFGDDDGPLRAELVAAHTPSVGSRCARPPGLAGAGRRPRLAGRARRARCRMGEAFAQAALAVLAGAGVAATDVAAIGSLCGQTVRHRPTPRRPSRCRSAMPARIVERTRIRHAGRRFPASRRRRRRAWRAAAARPPPGPVARRRRRPRGAQPGRHRQPHLLPRAGEARLRHRPRQCADGPVVPWNTPGATSTRTAPGGDRPRRRRAAGTLARRSVVRPATAEEQRPRTFPAPLAGAAAAAGHRPVDVQATLRALTARTIADAADPPAGHLACWPAAACTTRR